MFPCSTIWAPLCGSLPAFDTVGILRLASQNVKRMLAYSSIAHAGTCWAAFAGLGTPASRSQFYTAAYAAMNVASCRDYFVSGYSTSADDGRLPRLLYRSPLLGGLLLFFLVSLVGIHLPGILWQVLLFSSSSRWRSRRSGDIGLLNSDWGPYYFALRLRQPITALRNR